MATVIDDIKNGTDKPKQIPVLQTQQTPQTGNDVESPQVGSTPLPAPSTIPHVSVNGNAPQTSAGHIAPIQQQPTQPEAVPGTQPLQAQGTPKVDVPEDEKPAQFNRPSGSGDPSNPNELPKFKSNADMVRYFQSQSMPSAEEIAKEQKLENGRATLGYIGDAFSALSNLYFTSKGALSSKVSDLTGQNQKRLKELRDKRKKDQDYWRNALIGASQRDMEQQIQNMRYEREDKYRQQQQENWYRNYLRQMQNDADNKARKDRDADSLERYRNGNLEAKKKAMEDTNAYRDKRLGIDMYKATHKGGGSGSGKSSKEKYESLDYISKDDLNAGKRYLRTVNIPREQWTNGTIVNEMAQAIMSDPEAMAKVSERGDARSLSDLKKMTAAQKQQFVKDNWLFSDAAKEAARKAADIYDWSKVPYKNGASETESVKSIPFKKAGNGKGKSIQWAN